MTHNIHTKKSNKRELNPNLTLSYIPCLLLCCRRCYGLSFVVTFDIRFECVLNPFNDKSLQEM